MPSTIQFYHAANSPVTAGRKATSWSHILRGTHAKWQAPEWDEIHLEGLAWAYDSHEEGRGGPISCISYTSRAFGSIKFETVKIDDLDCERLFRLLNNSAARSMVKIPESCTTDGTTQIIDQLQNGNTLFLWRNDVERKIVMISLQRPVSWNGNFKRIECEQANRLDAGDASRARLPQQLGVNQSHVVASILFAIANSALEQMSYAATRKLSPKSRRAFQQKKETSIMYMTQEQPNPTALPIDKCASALGIDEFSLLSRIQTGILRPFGQDRAKL